MAEVQAGQEVVLLNPKAEHDHKEIQRASRLPTLKGASIVVINALRNPQDSSGDVLTSYIGDLLLRQGVDRVLPLRKEEAPEDMPEVTLDYIVSQAQGAIILEGD